MRGVLPVPPARREGLSTNTPPPSQPSPLDGVVCPAPLAHHDHIVLGHGGGGRLTAELIERLFRPLLSSPLLRQADDAAVIELGASLGRLAFSTDAHIVYPLEFPGGDIGRLAIAGTVNDLAMVGAQPRWLSAAFIIEEGLSTELLARITRSMRDAGAEAGVEVVAADTKVAPRGKVDGLQIATSGIGFIPPGRDVRCGNARAGDAVLLSGPIGNHGIAVLAARGELAFQSVVRSDTASLNGLVERLFACAIEVHTLRDPTRGGLAASLNEIARASGVSIVLQEKSIPVDPEVSAACEMLGFDPLHIANEGKLVAFVPEAQAGPALEAMRRDPLGQGACRIGRVQGAPAGRVLLETALGPTRIVEMPAGELLPRIC